MKKRYTQHAIFPFNRCSCGNVATHCEFEKDATNRGDDVLVNSWCEVCYKTQPQLTPNSMSNTERSVEEIVEEFKRLTVLDVNLGGWNITYEGALNYKQYEWLTQTLQTERQKREEAVIAEREKTAKAYGGCTNCYGKGYATVIDSTIHHADFVGDKTYITPNDPVRFCSCERGKQLEALTQPNNSK